MSFVALVGGFALYLGIPLVLDMLLGESGCSDSTPRFSAGSGLGQNGSLHAGASALGADDAARSSSPFLDSVWAKHCEQRGIREAERAREKHDAMWRTIKGEITGSALRPFRDSGLPSPLTTWDRLPLVDRDAILSADMDRLLGPKAEPHLIDDIVEHQATEPREREDGDDQELWNEDDDA